MLKEIIKPLATKQVHELGTVRPCLVAMWGGVHEGTAKYCESKGYDKHKFWLITVMQARGKGGKEVYPVTGSEREENGSFVLL